ncbi:MAG: Protein UmuC [Chlamydiia bacterium]|nr:Protein UmuC [Chlamydiia bacterium]
MYILVDCNNFFASCEQVFNPALLNKPLVILSSNDGCVIARSKEAKQLGIPMCAPAFKYKSLFLQHNVITLSSNFLLYGDLSKRVMDILSDFNYPIEIYSIDEAFIKTPNSLSDEELIRLAKEIRAKVLQWVGITLSIGIAPTKTLAKVADEIAKKEETLDGVMALTQPNVIEKELRRFPIEEVWGIGRRYAKLCKRNLIQTAWDLTCRKDDWIKKQMTIFGLRTTLELRGTPCVEHEVESTRKSMCVSRSFSNEITTLDELKEAIASFVAKGAAKLRKEKLNTGYICIFIANNRFRSTPFSESCHIKLHHATNHTPTLIEYAMEGLKSIYSKEHSYKKGGIYFYALSDEEAAQRDIFISQEGLSDKQQALMKVLDATNQRFGPKTLYYAAEGSTQKWQSFSKFRTPNYTTSWEELPKVKIK